MRSLIHKCLRLDTRRAVLVLLVLVPLAILFGPLEQRSYRYTWDAEEDGSHRTLLLIDAEPRYFELRLACRELNLSNEPVEIFATGMPYEQDRSLKLVLSSSKAKLETRTPDVHGQTVNLQLRGITMPCGVQVTYESSQRRLTLTSAEKSVSQTFEYPRPFEVNGLHLLSGIDEVRAQAEIVSEPLSVHRPGVVNLLGLIGAVTITILAIGRLLSKVVWREVGRVRPGWTEITAAILVFLTTMFDLPRYDDGWWRMMARNLGHTGQSSQYFIGNLENPIGLVHLWLLQFSDFFIGARFPLFFSMFCYVLTWVVIKRGILPKIAAGPPSKFVELSAFVAYLAFVFAWMATLRPEPFIAALFSLALWIGDRPRQPHDDWSEVARRIVLASIAGVALNTHILGLMCIVPVFGLFIDDVRIWRSRGGGFAPLSIWLASGLFGFGWVFIGSNFTRAIRALSLFNDVLGWQAPGGHDLGPLDEFRRWNVLEAFGTQPQHIALVVTGFALVGLLLATFRRIPAPNRRQSRRIALTCILAMSALLVTTSKLHWHLGVLAPATVIGLASLARAIESMPSRSRYLLGIAVLVGTAFGAQWSSRIFWRPNHYAPFGLQFTKLDLANGLLSHFLGRGSSFGAWLLLLSVMICATALTRQFGSKILVACLAPLILIGALAQFIPTAMDWSIAQGRGAWSWSGQQFDQVLLRPGRCGAPAYARVGGQQIAALLESSTETIAIPPWLQPTANCSTTPRIVDGVWVLPKYVYGPLDLDQRRFLSEGNLEQLTCYVDCFSRLMPRFDSLEMESATWN